MTLGYVPGELNGEIVQGRNGSGNYLGKLCLNQVSCRLPSRSKVWGSCEPGPCWDQAGCDVH